MQDMLLRGAANYPPKVLPGLSSNWILSPFFELAGGVGIEEAVAFEQILATPKGLPFLQPLLTEKHSQGAQREVLGEGGTSVKVRGNL